MGNKNISTTAVVMEPTVKRPEQKKAGLDYLEILILVVSLHAMIDLPIVTPDLSQLLFWYSQLRSTLSDTYTENNVCP